MGICIHDVCDNCNRTGKITDIDARICVDCKTTGRQPSSKIGRILMWIALAICYFTVCLLWM